MMNNNHASVETKLLTKNAYHVGALEGVLKYYVAVGCLPGVKVTDAKLLEEFVAQKLADCESNASKHCSDRHG